MLRALCLLSGVTVTSALLCNAGMLVSTNGSTDFDGGYSLVSCDNVDDGQAQFCTSNAIVTNSDGLMTTFITLDCDKHHECKENSHNETILGNVTFDDLCCSYDNCNSLDSSTTTPVTMLPSLPPSSTPEPCSSLPPSNSANHLVVMTSLFYICGSIIM